MCSPETKFLGELSTDRASETEQVDANDTLPMAETLTIFSPILETQSELNLATTDLSTTITSVPETQAETLGTISLVTESKPTSAELESSERTVLETPSPPRNLNSVSDLVSPVDSGDAEHNTTDQHMDMLLDRINSLEKTVQDLQGTNQQLLTDLACTREQRNVVQAKLVSLEESVSKVNKTCRCGNLKTTKVKAKPANSPVAEPSTTQSPSANRCKPRITVLSSSMGRSLSTELNQRGKVTCYGSVNPSATIEHLSSKSADVSRINTPDYVVLVVGGNNVSNGDRPRQVIGAMENLIKRTKENNPDATVVVSNIFKRSAQPHLDRPIDVINKVLSKKAKTSDFVFIDTTNKIKPEHLKRDGVHLNNKGVSQLASAIENSINVNSQAPAKHGPQRPPFHQGHQKVHRLQQNIPVLTSVRPDLPCHINPWL